MFRKHLPHDIPGSRQAIQPGLSRRVEISTPIFTRLLVSTRKLGKQESQEVFGASLEMDGLAFLEAIVESHRGGGWAAV